MTASTPLAGSGLLRSDNRGADGEWIRLQEAVVYFDHPQDAPVDHALCIDFRGRDLARVAVELDAASARALAESILAILADDEVRALV